jgi:2,3-bisphosphoglycerate-dependent phosphoglycerate mutase
VSNEPAPDTRLVLIRHGESRSAVDRIVGGHQGCTGLSELGRRQAEALRDRLARTGELGDASVVLTSVLPRAIETADIIAPALGGLAAHQHCDLCEIHPGDADGLTWEEFEARYRNTPASRSPYQPGAPGGESRAEFFLRVGTALRRAADENAGRTVIVVCHGGVIEGSLAAFGNQPLRRSFDLNIENTSLTEWTRPADNGSPGGEARWRLVRFNDSAHLHGVD